LAEWIIETSLKFYPAVIGIEEGKFKSIQELLEILIPQLIDQGEIPKDHLRPTAFQYLS